MSATDAAPNTAHASEALREADRLMVVCNSCRYCEGLCPVFPAMELRRAFSDGDLNYLANLCHNCGACYDDCQFSPPHEFAVNVPQTLAAVRNDSYQVYAWPRSFSGLFANSVQFVGTVLACSVVLFALTFAAHPGGVAAQPAGLFYRVLSHQTLVYIFGTAFAFAVFAIAVGVVRFWRDIGEPTATLREADSLWPALKDSGRLRYLDGGKGGCGSAESTQDSRKVYHHLTFYGFLLCFASTSVATLYHYIFGWEAPYAWYDLPVVLGSLGGVGLIIGPVGLLRAKFTRPRELSDERRTPMDVTFIVMLFLTSLTGLALLTLRGTFLMSALLAVHLGVVIALFVTMPYGKFVHGFYRYFALVRYSKEIKTHTPAGDE